MTSVTISGLVFELNDPFKEGHIMTDNEAKALNKAYHDGVRNSASGKTRSLREEGKNESEIRNTIDAFIDNYRFGARTVIGADKKSRIDPVEAEARLIARDKINSKLRDRGEKIRGRKAEIEALVDGLLAKYPEIYDAARNRINAAQSVAMTELDDIMNNAA